MTNSTIKKELHNLQRQIDCFGCKDCIDLICEEGQIPIQGPDGLWICGNVDSGSAHDPVTLNADTPTQDSANLSGQELQLVPATDTTYGVVKLEDIHDEVTLNADTPTQDSLNLAGQEIQVNPATNTEYGVVKLEDLSIHDPITLNADQPTQDSLNLVGQEIQVNTATNSTYGVVRLSDVVPTVVANYSALPAVGTVTGKFYWASASQGTRWLPGSLGGTYYSAGLYYSNGISWEFMDVPYQATQVEVDAGIVTDKFVTPFTLNSATTVSHPGHTHVVADITDYVPETTNIAIVYAIALG